MEEEDNELGNEENEISENPETNLQTDTSGILKVKNIRFEKQFIDPSELSGISHSEVECQTYIQNVDKVHIPIELINEATQTFYIGNLANEVSEVIAAIKKKSIPLLKTSQLSQTIITFDEEYPQDIIYNQLLKDITNDHIDSETASKKDILEIEVWHAINHAIERAFWISDPVEPIKIIKESETQTKIGCDFKTGKIICYQETQTGLTCKPKYSNSELLSDYLKTKNVAKDCLDECLANGVYSRIIIDDIMDEILDNCAREIHLPYLDNTTQTLASYKMMKETDEDILKKLKRPVVVDPMESEAVVALLTDDILKITYTQVTKDAECIVKYIVCVLIKKSVQIAKQLEDSRKQIDPKPLDHVFIQRRRELAKSMRKKPETETASTQTKLAGVPEIEKLKEPLEVLCSVCTRESECRFCSGSQEDVKLQEKILRTQDILLAYRPCYIRTTPDEAEIYNPQPIQFPKKNENITKICSQSSTSESTSSDSNSTYEKRVETVKRKLCEKTSSSGWSNLDLPPSKLWSLQDSRSVCCPSSSKSTNKISLKSVNKLSSKSESINVSKSQNNLTPQVVAAFKILKSAFCTRETCPVKDLNSEIDSHSFSEGSKVMSEDKRKNKINKKKCQNVK